jgi:uncharacterized membrane protein YgaE (UPF0421/DUF939 family)
MQIPNNLRQPLRALVALCLALLAYHFINEKYNYWIVLTTALLLPTTTGATMQKAIGRVAGTLIGVLLGLMFVAIMPFNTALYFSLIFVCLFFALYLSKSHYSHAMVASGALVVLLLSYFMVRGNVQLAWTFVLARFFDTLLAATIVIVAAYVCWPESSVTKAKQIAHDLQIAVKARLIHQLQYLNNTSSQPPNHSQLCSIYKKIVSLEQLISNLHNEPEISFLQRYVSSANCYGFQSLYNNLLAIESLLPVLKKQTPNLPMVMTAINNFLALLEADDSTFIIKGYVALVDEIRKMQSQGANSLFVKHVAVGSLLLNVRDVCMRLEYINNGKRLDIEAGHGS